MAALDTINQQYGRDTVQLRSASIMQRWAMKTENRTLKFTTYWHEHSNADSN
jgi:hypothetical protein